MTKAVKQRPRIELDYKLVFPTPNYPDGMILGLRHNGLEVVVAKNFPVPVAERLEQVQGPEHGKLKLANYVGKILSLDPAVQLEFWGQNKSLAELTERLYETNCQLEIETRFVAQIKKSLLPTGISLCGAVGTLAASVLVHPALALGLLPTGVLALYAANREVKGVKQMEKASVGLGETIRLGVLEAGKRQGGIPVNYGVRGFTKNTNYAPAAKPG